MASRAEVIVASKRTKTMGVSKKTRFEVFKRDKFTCQYCGKRPPDVVLECDHIVPRAEGGQDEVQNLTTACFECNRGKGATPLGDVAPHLDEMAVLESVQEMLERKMALKVEIETAKAEREAEDEAVALLMTRWEEVHEDGLGFNKSSVRTFLTRLGFREVDYAMDVAIAWSTDKEDGDYRQAFKYFCGVCWALIRKAESNGGT